MSTETPIVTNAKVELTFANGVTRRLILDDKDATVALSLDVTRDIHETTKDGASFRTFDPGPRQRVDVHLTGRGPLQLDIPDPREAIDELRTKLDLARLAARRLTTVLIASSHLLDKRFTNSELSPWTRGVSPALTGLRAALGMDGVICSCSRTTHATGDVEHNPDADCAIHGERDEPASSTPETVEATKP